MNSVFRFRRSDRSRGFSMIEMIVAVVIVGILVSIAIPVYTGYVQKANRSTAKTALLDLAQREEKFFSINNRYSNSAAELGYASFPVSIPTTGPVTYSLAAPVLTVGPPAGFSATASRAAGNQANDACGDYSLDSLGRQTVAGNTQASGCW